MDAVLGRTTKPMTSPPALVLGVAAAVAVTFYMIGSKPILGGTLRPAPPPADCLISGSSGFRPLRKVDSLENCGVQLEGVYLEDALLAFADSLGLGFPISSPANTRNEEGAG